MKLTDYSEENQKIMNLDLKGLREKTNQCERCRLNENRTNAVLGSGSKDADIMLIGEAPGAKEDEQGKPFVGSAGEKLDTCLEKASIKRKEIFITNTVRCRPPKNRDPKKDELKKCEPYTKRLIKLVDPKVIGLLGRIPTLQHTGKKSITKVRGEEIEKEERTYIPTFHPAALIYQPNRKEKLIKDLKSLREYSERH